MIRVAVRTVSFKDGLPGTVVSKCPQSCMRSYFVSIE